MASRRPIKPSEHAQRRRSRNVVKLVRGSSNITGLKQNEDEFPVPRDRKGIFAKGLEVHENSSQSKKDLAEKIRTIFATGVTEENYVRFFHNLLWYEETTVNIDMMKYDMYNVSLQQNLQQADCYVLVVPNLDQLSLKRGNKVNVRPRVSEAWFEARITATDKDMVSLLLPYQQFRQYSNSHNMKFDVKFMWSRTCLERMHCAVAAMQHLSNRTRVFPVLDCSVNVPYNIQKQVLLTTLLLLKWGKVGL
ncbi:hypothetical protein O0L34_g3403 [Tuta absoluta]|nr:hypothetical protein O0L34_g3403 [Tuta absoluta]